MADMTGRGSEMAALFYKGSGLAAIMGRDS